MAADMVCNSLAISEKTGLESRSVDQHLSINDLHAGSHQLGILGRRVTLIIPAEYNINNVISVCVKKKNEVLQVTIIS